MTEPLLVVRELDKNFGGVQAVKGLSLEIAAGEIVGLIGPNGSGKSTSVNLISGTMRATRGQILLGGHDISTATIGERVALGLARTFQTTSLFPEFSLLEQVLLGAHTRFETKAAQAIFRTKPYRQEDAAQRERAADLLEFMGLLGVAHLTFLRAIHILRDTMAFLPRTTSLLGRLFVTQLPAEQAVTAS